MQPQSVALAPAENGTLGANGDAIAGAGIALSGIAACDHHRSV
jgi:hypothetical protein